MTRPMTEVFAELEQGLRRRFRTKETLVPVEGGDVRILQPANSDDLISEEDFIRDERLPYWADLWPSAVAFARAAHRLLPPTGRVLELGCGAGLLTAVAARLGHDVVATDYYEEALLFARLNAFRNAGREVEARMVDWRSVPADLGRFEIIIASDVLYEAAYAPLVADVIATSLLPGGVALVADPGRVAAPQFVERVHALGLPIHDGQKLAWTEGELSQLITVFEVGARR